MKIISIQALRKTFRARTGKGPATVVDAVQGIDMEVESGEIFVLLGPDGAGKSTTLRILSTLLPPDSGTVLVDGHDLRSEPGMVRRLTGYVSQAGGLMPSATGMENLLLHGRLHGLTEREAVNRAGELVAALELAPFADRLVETYSAGQRRKLDIAVGMVHRPKILFLDEPTTGLDSASQAQLWTVIRCLRQEGTTVVLTTHSMEEANALCDRVAFIDHGRIATQGPGGLTSRDADLKFVSV